MTAFAAVTLGVEIKKDAIKSLEIWHKRLRHVNYSMIKEMEQKITINGLYMSN
jgi:hypothetical protein